MSHYITTHNPEGQAIFSNKIPTEAAPLPLPFGKMTILSTTHDMPLNLSNEADIDQYAKDRMNGLGNAICPANGTITTIIEAAPNAASPLHRTMSLDTCIVIEGVMELHLDGGETRLLKAGDSVVQRGVMHKWINKTPNDGIAKMVAIATPIVAPIEIGGKKLDTDFVW